MKRVRDSLIDCNYRATKTFTQLIAEGVQHRGGLAELAQIEQLENPGPQLMAIREGYLAMTFVDGDGTDEERAE